VVSSGDVTFSIADRVAIQTQLSIGINPQDIGESHPCGADVADLNAAVIGFTQYADLVPDPFVDISPLLHCDVYQDALVSAVEKDSDLNPLTLFFLKSHEKAKNRLLELLHQSRERVAIGSNGDSFAIPHMRDLTDEARRKMSISASKRWEKYRAEKAGLAASSNGAISGSKKVKKSS
jgi:hypothetical protein